VTRFGTVLVANRGEIARRVIRAASAAGLNSVAVYSDADIDAPHVREADTAVRLGPGPAAESYLSIPALLDAAARTGADAVHPGYGFLSERAAFAREVTEAGLVFVGPSASVIEAMANKDNARVLAADAGVPVMPAADTSAGTDLDSVVDQIGVPLMVKAAAGGGGKGMRIVRATGELADAVAAARREAAAAFGDDTLLFERYVEHGRHIEVQVVGDEHGSVVHLFERDCSVQRRHQKVIEEAPAPTISHGLRELVTSSAVALAKSVGYVNAGTVEFLVTGEEAYFLEMNTRLQVEHPVTELVTGIDLVHLQFTVAQGQPLPFGQADVAVQGHAIEARVYAEDPAAGFLPQAGVATVVSWPARVRVDAALESGQEVSTFYDPMLGKVIATGANREAARRSLVTALDETAILGLTTNAGFLRTLADSTEFREVAVDTAWLDGHPDAFARDTPTASWCLAASSLMSSVAEATKARNPFGGADGWRVSAPPAAVPLDLVDAAHPADRRLLRFDVTSGRLSGLPSSVTLRRLAPAQGWDRLEIDGQVHEGRVLVTSHEVHVAYRGQTYVFERPDAFAAGARSDLSDGVVAAPMPGTLLAVEAGVGDDVKTGDRLAVMEAMKMELVLKAPLDGVVAEVDAEPGSAVGLGQRLFRIEPAESPELAEPSEGS
jgi:acetyl/propionyl-CoA carboxylase alpha subunit